MSIVQRILLSCLLCFLCRSSGNAQDWAIDSGRQVELNGFAELSEVSSWFSDMFVFGFGSIRIEDINDHSRIFVRKSNGEWGFLGRESRRENYSESFMASDGIKCVYMADCHGSTAFIKRLELKHDDKAITVYAVAEDKVVFEGRKLRQCGLVANGGFVMSVVGSFTEDESKPGVLLAICSKDGGDSWEEPVKVAETALGCFTRNRLASKVGLDGSVSIYDIGLNDKASGQLPLFRKVFVRHNGYIQTAEQAKVMLGKSYTLVRHDSVNEGKTWKTTQVKLEDDGGQGVLRVPIQIAMVNDVETLVYLLVSGDRSKPDAFMLARRAPGSTKYECTLLARAADSLIGDPLSFQFSNLMKSRLVSAGSHLLFVQYETVGRGVSWSEWRPLMSADAGKTWRSFDIWKDQSIGPAFSDKKLGMAAAHDQSHIVFWTHVTLHGRSKATFRLGSYGPSARSSDK